MSTLEELQRCIESQRVFIQKLCAIAEVKADLDAPTRRRMLELARTVLAPGPNPRLPNAVAGPSIDEKNLAATLLAQMVVRHVLAPGPVSVPDANLVEDGTMTTGGKRVS